MTSTRPWDCTKRVATVIAHEMAHQWFGDLVTMQWWDDIWLNEGFASWMETKAVGAWKPEWHFELADVEDTTASLNSDSLKNTRPIHQAAETPAADPGTVRRHRLRQGGFGAAHA